MSAPNFAGADDQDRLLDEATAVVKEQAFYLKRAIDNDNTRDALKTASNLICELRTSLLSPKNYYELYMQVFQEMQNLHAYFCDKGRHGRKMLDLYESVQHAGNILPRLYLLATVGSAYIKSKEAGAKEILTDVSELCKGVQHPLRGLFLRYYLSQMMKDKLPDTGTEYEAMGGGNIDDAFEFIFNNFNESNKLWVRIQNQGAAKDKARREKERHDLRVLVGANLVRMSQLEGMTVDFYATKALPQILEHIVSVKDTMSQQYLLESMIQVFPDEFHIKTLENLLLAYAKSNATVDMKPIVVTLMNRLAAYLSDSVTGQSELKGIDVFSLFRTHLTHILERVMQPGAAGAAGAPTPEVGACLEIQAAFMQFTLSLYPDKIHYVDLILSSTGDIVRKWCSVTGNSHVTGNGAEKVVDLLAYPLKTLSLQVLEMENTTKLMEFLDFGTRKKVAISMVNIVTGENHSLTSVESVTALFNYISSLVRDEADTPQTEGQDKVQFLSEQQSVAKLAHQIRSDDLDVEFAMLVTIRGFFGKGGPQRLAVTLPATFYAALGLLPKLRAAELRRAEDGTEAPGVTAKKVFQFVHKTVIELREVAPETALGLWFVAAAATDTADKASGQPGAMGMFCYEFLTQGFLCFEEDVTETNKQFKNLFTMVGTLCQISCMDAENYEVLAQKITKHAGRLLKKPLMIRAVALCAHLFWSQSKRDGTTLLQCLQKCLKVLQPLVDSDATQVGLWVEMLDKYVYFYEAMVEEINLTFIQQLMDLCKAQIDEAMHSAADDAKKAKTHFKEVVKHLKAMQKNSNPEVSGRFAELVVPDS